MSEEKFRINFGTVQLMEFNKFEDGRVVSYCYSIERDINGGETSRTEPVRIGSLGYDNGKDFTEDDYNFYRYGSPKTSKSIFSRIVDLFK